MRFDEELQRDLMMGSPDCIYGLCYHIKSLPTQMSIAAHSKEALAHLLTKYGDGCAFADVATAYTLQGIPVKFNEHIPKNALVLQDFPNLGNGRLCVLSFGDNEDASNESV